MGALTAVSPFLEKQAAADLAELSDVLSHAAAVMTRTLWHRGELVDRDYVGGMIGYIAVVARMVEELESGRRPDERYWLQVKDGFGAWLESWVAEAVAQDD
jgi:hypothetical protein